MAHTHSGVSVCVCVCAQTRCLSRSRITNVFFATKILRPSCALALKWKYNILRTNPTKKLLCPSNVLVITISNILQWEWTWLFSPESAESQLLQIKWLSLLHFHIKPCGKYQRETDWLFYYCKGRMWEFLSFDDWMETTWLNDPSRHLVPIGRVSCSRADACHWQP